MSLSDDIDSIESGLSALHRARYQHRAWAQTQQEAGIQLDMAEVALLRAVEARSGRPCRMQDLARSLAIEAPSVTRTVKLLEQRQLVKRTVDQNDGRVWHVRLTRRGTNLLTKWQDVHRRKLERLFRHWSAAERKQFAAMINRLADDLSPKTTNLKP